VMLTRKIAGNSSRSANCAVPNCRARQTLILREESTRGARLCPRGIWQAGSEVRLRAKLLTPCELNRHLLTPSSLYRRC